MAGSADRQPHQQGLVRHERCAGSRVSLPCSSAGVRPSRHRCSKQG